MQTNGFMCQPIYFSILIILLVPQAVGQGSFFGSNSAETKTRIAAIGGPLASSNILGQFLVGTNADSLSPVGMPLAHHSGVISAGRVTVPGVDGGVYAWVQMVAWDRLLWGESFSGVPADQFGRTDIVSIFLSYFWQPVGAPTFTQAAIVPVPEPTLLALGFVGACLIILASRRCRAKPRRGTLDGPA
jgi:hypothetical protein